MRSKFYMLSSDGCTRLHGCIWRPEGEVKGVLQITHGMVEHIERYDEFARYLNRCGFAVIGHDHLGHGYSVRTQGHYGYFAERNGHGMLIKDVHHVTRQAKRLFPGVPVFVLGHSMGSFILRRYITLYGQEIDGAVIMATGHFSLPMVLLGKGLAGCLEKWKGGFYKSDLLHGVLFGHLMIGFGHGRRKGSWLSKDEELVRRYKEDERCGFRFTVSAYYSFLNILEDLARQKDFDRIPRDLPLLLVSGMEDALGGFTRRALQVYNQFTAMKMQDVDIRFYRDARHEILNELDRDLVYVDIRDWLAQHDEKRPFPAGIAVEKTAEI